nr:unnamed protein product [Digitaria exilis]
MFELGRPVHRPSYWATACRGEGFRGERKTSHLADDEEFVGGGGRGSHLLPLTAERQQSFSSRAPPFSSPPSYLAPPSPPHPPPHTPPLPSRPSSLSRPPAASPTARPSTLHFTGASIPTFLPRTPTASHTIRRPSTSPSLPLPPLPFSLSLSPIFLLSCRRPAEGTRGRPSSDPLQTSAVHSSQILLSLPLVAREIGAAVGLPVEGRTRKEEKTEPKEPGFEGVPRVGVKKNLSVFDRRKRKIDDDSWDMTCGTMVVMPALLNGLQIEQQQQLQIHS